jgi:P4 family phage/plasmid primase-like protien
MTEAKGLDDVKGAIALAPIDEKKEKKVEKAFGKSKSYVRHVANTILESEKLIYSEERFYLWCRSGDGAHYKMIEEREVCRAIEMVSPKHYTTRVKNEALDLLKNATYRRIEVFKHVEGNNIVNLSNGVFDVGRSALRPALPTDYFLSVMPVSYDPNAQCPVFERVMSENLQNDDISLIQEFMGYCLIRATKYEKALILCGRGANGKGIITHVLNAMFGDDFVASMGLQRFSDPKAAGQLFGKMVNLSTESSSKAVSWSEDFKVAISGEKMLSDDKYRPRFQFNPYAKHIITMNDRPYLEDKSDGVSRRLLIVEFEKQYDETNRDVDLKDFLAKNELPGILNWMIVGLKRLIERKHFGTTEKQKEIVAALKIESDSALSFVEDCCDYKDCFENDRVKKKDLYDSYKAYCKDSNYKPYSNRRFYREVKGHYQFEERIEDGYPHFVFVRLKDKDMTNPQEGWQNS